MKVGIWTRKLTDRGYKRQIMMGRYNERRKMDKENLLIKR